jgi:hypothetical protein
MKPKEYE